MRIEDARPTTVVHILLVPVLALALSVSVAGASLALEPGVHVDPGSPAAKEYALPLDQARETGHEGSTRAGSSPALFGAGISPARTGGHSNGSGRPGDPRFGGRGAAAGLPGRPSAAGAPRSAAAPAARADTGSDLLARQTSSAAGGTDSTLALIGGGVLVLALAAFVGVVLRGGRTPRPG